MGRIATPLLILISACSSERTSEQARASTSIERSIESALGERVRVPIRVRCGSFVPRCRARLPDGSELPIAMGMRDGEIEWRVVGALVLADEIEEYLLRTLDEMGTPQVARCGARIRSVAPGDRVECGLSHGGRAFVIVNADGTTSVEIDLDAAAGAARTEPHRDIELLEMSRKLDHAAESDDD